MQRPSLFLLLPLVFGWLSASSIPAHAQDPSTGADEVVRVNTNLVQTDVMVFDKRGGFVEGLKRDRFVLKVDGKPREISFFEQVRAGSRNEDAQLAAARGVSLTAGVTPTNSPVPLDRGRTIFFFIDDLHLSPASMNQVQRLLTTYLTRDLRQNDQAAITSTTGQIGFLQQLTDNKTVLRAAVNRLKPYSASVPNLERPPMS
ncbi:MAG: VWA domain-containing protein, partial [Acidobacteriota bacterium]